jgi:heme-degrading monooxygenase HmoA
MIARMWRGSAIRERADDYVKHLQQSVVLELRQIDGFKGVYLLRRNSSDDVEFLVMTLWESMDAICKFAGENPEVAVVAPAARVFFREYDVKVKHFEIVLNLEGKPLVGELGSNLCF